MHKLLKIALSSVLVFLLLPAPLGAVRDAGTTQVIFPTGEIPYEAWMLPLNVQAQAMVKNFGDSTMSFPVQLRIDTALVGTCQVTNLPAHESVLVWFPVTLPDSGTHSIACSTELVGDVQPANDRIVDSFETYLKRVRVVPLSPETAQVGATITLLVNVRYSGSVPEMVPLLLTISRLLDSVVVYEDFESTYVLPGQDNIMTFVPWTPDSVGVYKCLLTIGPLIPQLPDTLSWFITVVGSGIEERETPNPGRITSIPTVVRGVLQMPLAASRMPPAALLDISGRKVLELHPGPNDVSRLGAGVYFVRSAKTGERSAVRRVVLTR
jgi:hypothetical protein